MMCLPIVLKIFGPCRGSQPGFVVVWKPSFSRGENVLSTIDVPSGYVKIAIENGPSIVDLPIEHGDFL